MPLKKIRAVALHQSVQSTISRMASQKRNEISRQEKLHLLKSLREIKQNADAYKLSELQKKLLEHLIQKARTARTESDLIQIHSKTCGLGLEKF
jgi:uncharacterized protein (DUF2225 family)